MSMYISKAHICAHVDVHVHALACTHMPTRRRVDHLRFRRLWLQVSTEVCRRCLNQTPFAPPHRSRSVISSQSRSGHCTIHPGASSATPADIGCPEFIYAPKLYTNDLRLFIQFLPSKRYPASSPFVTSVGGTTLGAATHV